MTFFDNLQTRITGLDEKSWYQYLAIAAGIFFLLVSIILFFYFRSLSKWEQRIADLNETRQEVKKLLDKAERVQKERQEVTAILDEDPNFKIKEYIDDTLEKIGILGNKASGIVVPYSREDSYEEDIATYQIYGISMKQLTEFLHAIDENKRVFTKELDITKSKQVPRAIDVEVKIATMMPKKAA
jgi:hypothetical protein